MQKNLQSKNIVIPLQCTNKLIQTDTYNKSMKKIFFSLVGSIAFCASLFAARQNTVILHGSIRDEAGEPAAYATAFITKADGSIAAGVSADEQGAFELAAPAGEYTLTVALVGYKDAVQSVKMEGALTTLSPIVLKEDTELLGEAVVAAVMPKTKLTGEGLQTSVHGSVLENVGTANDVLGKVPGIIKSDKGIEVIGKGSPLIYINGHKVTDASELDRLLSSEIQSIEVISNPGAQYDASVRSVVRIRTVKRQGEGFGFNANISDEQSLRRANHNGINTSVNTNYRKGNFDLFAGIDWLKSYYLQWSEVKQETYSTPEFKLQGPMDGDGTIKYAHMNTGFNWQIADNHFTGMKVDLGSQYYQYDSSLIKNDIFLDNVLQDHLEATTIDVTGNNLPHTLGVNAYYNGNVGNLNIDFNLDYYGSFDNVHSTSDEISSIGDNAKINSDQDASNNLYAAKLVFSHPVWMGMLQLGTEETFSRTKSNYAITGASIPASSSAIKEDNIAAFASYGFMLGQVAQVSAGLRFEHVNYSYENFLGDDDLSRRYNNFFPSLSIAGVIGPVQASLSYSGKTSRPGFELLNDAIRYNNRFLLQSGNSKLQPQTLQNLSLAAAYGFFALQADFTRINNAVLTMCAPYNNQGVILTRPLNHDRPMHRYSAYLVATPTIGVWNLNYVVGLQGQNFTYDLTDPTQPNGHRTLSLSNKPIFFVQFENAFTFGNGWQLELGGMWRSKGYDQFYYVTNSYLRLNAAVQKTLLKDGSLVVRLSGADLLGTEANDIYGDFGSYKVWQTNIMDTQVITLSLRYKFNAATSKYKGTGAGKEARDRMK